MFSRGWRSRAHSGCVLTLLAGLPATAAGHIRMLEPAPRHEQQKSGPCGAGADDPRGDVVSTYAPGQTITVRWQETVPHPGYFRISLDPDGQDDFVDPPQAGEGSDDPVVLVDLIADKDGTQTYEQALTLPTTACERCTLQLVQVMTDKAPYGDGNDLYYQCADLVIRADAPATTGEPAEVDDGGCRVAAAPWWALLLLARRRRRG